MFGFKKTTVTLTPWAERVIRNTYRYQASFEINKAIKVLHEMGRVCGRESVNSYTNDNYDITVTCFKGSKLMAVVAIAKKGVKKPNVVHYCMRSEDDSIPNVGQFNFLPGNWTL